MRKIKLILAIICCLASIMITAKAATISIDNKIATISGNISYYAPDYAAIALLDAEYALPP